MEHDQLFKQLIHTYFVEFIALFAPEILEFLEVDSIEFLEQEMFTDISSGDRHEVDVLVKARFKGKETCFLIHIENQATSQKDFAARMFRYFARLFEKYGLPIYPIALFSFDSPQREEPGYFRIDFPNLNVLNFQFHAIQLNRLNWRDYLRKPNPVAAALMTKMKIAPEDRPKVALECVRIVATLKLDPARQTLIRTFVDSYLRLSAEEKEVYNREAEAIIEPERKVFMQVYNQWAEHAAREILVRMLKRKFGPLPVPVQKQINTLLHDKLESLADAVLDFSTVADLESWLAQNA